jgi:thioesterase domain-containing protein
MPQSSNNGRDPLVPLRMVGSKSPLFYIPGGTGDARECYGIVPLLDQLAEFMPQDRPVYAIRMDELFQTKKAVTVTQLASFCMQAVQNKQTHGPYYFLGYSLGGLVAYEMAAQLANRGEEIGLLALIDATNPTHVSKLSFAKSVGHTAIRVKSRLRKYWRNLFLGKIDLVVGGLWVFARYRFMMIKAFLIRTLFLIFNRPAPNVTQVFLTLEQAYQNYSALAYTERLVLFRSQNGESKFNESLTMGWEKCAHGRIDVHFVAGDHWTMISKPSVIFSEKLAAYLQD